MQLLLDGFIEQSAPPMPRMSRGVQVRPDDEAFSGFVFKIQANMDPNHRDRIVFIRVVSGRFTRDMTVTHVPTGKKMRLSNANKMFGRDRETIDEAYPGDVVGIAGAKFLSIGDTLSEDPQVLFEEIPHFPPECFAFLHNDVPSNHKRFREGLNQLLTEGVVHAFELPDAAQRIPLLAAVGPLQFDIVKYRLETEYNAASRLEMAPWTLARWFRDRAVSPGRLMLPGGVRMARDGAGDPVLLFPSEWSVTYFQDNNRDVELSEYPVSTPVDRIRRVA
ncbi:MAG TPA: EF-Tu/IF-2/RF-3 family GTPase [Deltaproteobacteria bacterium]|nr:EF-Tu/IF-2/RF-3 family GTPase [Deltaproteobacteria bacterium]